MDAMDLPGCSRFGLIETQMWAIWVESKTLRWIQIWI